MPLTDDAGPAAVKRRCRGELSPPLVARVLELLGACEQHEAILALRALRFLEGCGYHDTDIEVVVAHAAAYFLRHVRLSEKEGRPAVRADEAAQIFCAMLFIAHAYTLDETCPLPSWHKRLFETAGVPLRMLNQVVIHLVQRLGYILRLEALEFETQLRALRPQTAAAAA